MKQIGVDLCSLPEVDGYNTLVVAIDYFSKWSEAKPLKSKDSVLVAEILYELICHHGCCGIQINDQRREFVNKVSAELHRMTGVEQRITSVYHPQSNGLVERQNRTMKSALVNVLNENPQEWPYIVQGVLFAHRVSRHKSTEFLLFFMSYNREPTLPIDVKYTEGAPFHPNDDEVEEFDTKMFEEVLSSKQELRNKIHDKTASNIKEAQKRQKRDYERRHSSTSNIKSDDKVLLWNDKRTDRKGGKFTFQWLGPYIVRSITEKGVAILSLNGKLLKKKHNLSTVKLYVEGESGSKSTDPIVSVVPDEVDEVDDEKLPINFSDMLPSEIVLKILLIAMKSSTDKCNTYINVLRTFSRLQLIIKEKGKQLLPRIYISDDKDIRENSSYNGKIKVSVRKMSILYGKTSGLALKISAIINDKKWKSAWLVLMPDKESVYRNRYIVHRFYWETRANKLRCLQVSLHPLTHHQS